MTWYVQVKEICPYYFDLEDKFLEFAGTKTPAMTDGICCDTDDDGENNAGNIEVESVGGKNSYNYHENNSFESNIDNNKRRQNKKKSFTKKSNSAAKTKQRTLVKNSKRNWLHGWI